MGVASYVIIMMRKKDEVNVYTLTRTKHLPSSVNNLATELVKRK